MKHSEFIGELEKNPITAAVKDYRDLDGALKLDSRIVFILFGDIVTLPDIVKKVKNSGKYAMVHIDLIDGLSSKNAAVDYIKKYTRADGIITTKASLVQYAQKLGLNTILRFFVVDSMAMKNIEKHSQPGSVRPDIIEILPGILLPGVIRKICDISSVPVMTGGLISTKEEVLNALNAGAIAISTTNSAVWSL